MKSPFIDWIWHVKGSLPLDPPQSATTAFDKLAPLFDANGSNHQIDGNTLTYTKVNPAAQDKMATFTRGTLQLVNDEGQAKLVYRLTSKALLLCFLAPLLFLALGQTTIFLGHLEGPATEEEDSAEADEEEEELPQLHPLDIALGAPAPEKPDKDEEKEDNKHSPTTAYVLAAIFAVLYIVGRILEPWLVKSTFRKALSASPALSDAEASDQSNAPHPN